MFYFDDIFLIEMEGKGQVYIFYTMSSTNVHRIGMFEALIDEMKPDGEQLVLDWGELQVPSNFEDPISNNGPITLSGGGGSGGYYLMTAFERFSQIKGYTICPYDAVIQKEGSTVCSPLLDNTSDK